MSTRRSTRLSGGHEVPMMEVDLAGGGGVGLLKGRRRDAEDIPGLEPDKKRRKTLAKKASSFKPQPVTLPNSSDTPPDDEMDLPPPPSEKKIARRRDSTRELRERPRSPSPVPFKLPHPRQEKEKPSSKGQGRSRDREELVSLQPSSSSSGPSHRLRQVEGLEFPSLGGSSRSSSTRSSSPPRAFAPVPIPIANSRVSMGPPTGPFVRKTRKSMGGVHERPLESIVPVPENETPMIRKNKDMRDAQSRRSSLNGRGQRASSSLGKGDISIPHSSVPSNTFYQHISATTPEPIRARHLLIWCTKRATDAALAPPAKSKSKGKGRDETPRTEEGDKLLKDIMDDLMAKLGKGVVDTNIFQQGNASSSGMSLRPHPKNVANREIERKESEVIRRSKEEEREWGAISNMTNRKQTKLFPILEKKRQFPTPPDFSTAEAWMQDAMKLADGIIEDGDGDLNSVGEFADVEYKIDSLHQTTHAALQYSLQASRFLDGIFASLSADLQARERPPQRASHPSGDTDTPDAAALLAAARPPVASGSGSGSGSSSKPDPIHMLRALARAENANGEGPNAETLARVASVAPVPPISLSVSVSAAVASSNHAMTPRRPGMTPRRGLTPGAVGMSTGPGTAPRRGVLGASTSAVTDAVAGPMGTGQIHGLTTSSDE